MEDGRWKMEDNLESRNLGFALARILGFCFPSAFRRIHFAFQLPLSHTHRTGAVE
jgi:hypothetical protein